MYPLRLLRARRLPSRFTHVPYIVNALLNDEPFSRTNAPIKAIYAAGILSSLQAGVDPAVVSDYALAYVVARIGYMFFYQISFVNTLGFIRTNFFFLCLGINAKLFLLASAALKA